VNVLGTQAAYPGAPQLALPLTAGGEGGREASGQWYRLTDGIVCLPKRSELP